MIRYKNMLSRTLLFIGFVFSFIVTYAQQLPPGQYTSTNKKAIKYLEEGKTAFESKNDVVAEKAFKKALWFGSF